jgi:hypothetical protein
MGRGLRAGYPNSLQSRGASLADPRDIRGNLAIPLALADSNASASIFSTFSTATMGGLYLLDYGAGNVQSLANSLKGLGHDFQWISSPDDFDKASVHLAHDHTARFTLTIVPIFRA